VEAEGVSLTRRLEMDQVSQVTYAIREGLGWILVEEKQRDGL
jgi:hypothetical protein